MALPQLDTDPRHELTSGVGAIDRARPANAATDGQVVDVSVVFADLRGFTSIAEHGTPRHTATLLNGYLAAMMDVIAAYHGMVQDFVGDGIMAVFGIPAHDPEHAWHAAVSAVEMQAALRRLDLGVHLDRLNTQPIAVSMHSGDVFAGLVGSPRKWKYGVVGDTVNVAARLEELNRYLGTSILMSAQTRSLLSDRVEARRRGWFPIRGRSHPIEVYELLAVCA